MPSTVPAEVLQKILGKQAEGYTPRKRDVTPLSPEAMDNIKLDILQRMLGVQPEEGQFDREAAIKEQANDPRSYGEKYLRKLPDAVLQRYVLQRRSERELDEKSPIATQQQVLDTIMAKEKPLSPEYTGGKY